jgi:hypothetical protein
MTDWQQFEALLSAAVGYVVLATSWIPLNFETLLSTAVGAFIGAYAAFALERRDRSEEQIRARATEGNLALLTLFQMFSVLRQFQKEVISTAPEPGGRWMKMKVTFPQPDERLGFDPSRLAFLFECENKNVLPEILLEERRYHLAITMINRRSHLMLEKVHPKLAQEGVQHGMNIAEEAIKAVIGPALAAEALQLTEGIVQNVNEDVASLKTSFDELRKQLAKLLPKENFIQVEFDMPAPSKRDVKNDAKP